MKRTFKLRSSIACCLGVTDLSNPGVAGPIEHRVIWMSPERGAVAGMRDTPLKSFGWPQKLQDAINEHFAKVFALRHEDWSEPGPSPRAAYLEGLKPWIVECEE